MGPEKKKENCKKKNCYFAKKEQRSCEVRKINRATMVKPFLVLLVVLLPHTILCESVSSTDSDKYLQQLTPSQSLYCNDLNPQSHLDFNMVKILSDDSEISTAAKKASINYEFPRDFC